MQDQIAAIAPKYSDDVVNGYLDIWRRVLEATDFHAGCAVAGVITGGHDADMLDRGAAAYAATTDALADRFQQAGVPTGEAQQRSTLLVCAAEGAVLLARAQRTAEPLTRVAEQLTSGS
jgi:hypothetical protein